MATLGALVITRNEEVRIGACLDALAFCDERLVVDSFSTDRTLEIAAARADRVYCREFLHHADQKNWGLAQLETDWILIVDADEIVPAALAREVRDIVDRGAVDGRAEGSADAWWIHRRNHFFGREIRHCGWERDKVLRLLRRGRGQYLDTFLHEEIVLADGARVAHCRSRLDHHSYEDWESSFARLLSYSTRGALERQRRGRRARVRDLALRPAGRFLRQFVLQRGLADGAHGVALCAWSAAGVFLREAKLLLGETEVAGPDRNSGHVPRVRTVKGAEPNEPGSDASSPRAKSEERR